MTTTRSWRYDERYDTGYCPDLGSNSGQYCFAVTPGTAPADAIGMFIFEVSNDVLPSGSFIEVYFSAASSVTLSFNDGTNSGTGGFDASSSLASGTQYNCKVSYDSTDGQVVFDIDGTPVIEIDTEIRVEYYRNVKKNKRIVSGKLVKIFRGVKADALCDTIACHVPKLLPEHYLYLGRQLQKAEDSLRTGKKFVQDGC